MKNFIILFLLLLSVICKEEQVKTETCDDNKKNEVTSTQKSDPKSSQKDPPPKKEKKYLLINEEYFRYQPVIQTSLYDPYYFDFDINDKIVEYLNNNSIVVYPRYLFKGKKQGNFLNFFHIVYEKHLPLYFSIDHILYPYIEITKNITQEIIEVGVYNIFHKFLTTTIKYAKKNEYDQDIISYFSLGMKFLDKEFKFSEEENKFLKNITENILKPPVNESDNYFNFSLFNHTKEINKINFIDVANLFNINDTTRNVFYCLTFYRNLIMKTDTELFIIYNIGKIIVESGNADLYKHLKKYFKYIFNEFENVMNPVEIYKLINSLYLELEKKKSNFDHELYKKIEEKIKKINELSILNEFTFLNKEQEKIFESQFRTKLSLFSYFYNFDQWIPYKLLSYEKKRLFPSYHEFISIIGNSSYMEEKIKEKYTFEKGKNKSSRNMFKFRDGVDMQEEYNSIKKSVSESFVKEKTIWRNSFSHSFDYLLHLIGESKKEFYSKNSSDYFISYLEKQAYDKMIYETLAGSYIHFKNDIYLMSESPNASYAVNGSLIDVYFDTDHVKIYEELKEITKTFQEYSLDIINDIENKEIKNKLINYVKNKISKLFVCYDNVLKAINYENNNEYDSPKRREIIDKMFYYDKKLKIYQGWYVDLYRRKNESEIVYDLDIFAYNYYIANPIKELEFKGAIIYEAMNYPEIGLIAIRDKKEKNKKRLFAFSSYIGNEYPHGWSKELDFDGLRRMIFRRQSF